MSCVGRMEMTPSFTNLDGALPPSPLFPSLPPPSFTICSSSSTPSGDSDVENGREEDIIDVGKCDYDKIAPFCSVYNTPPAKVRSSIPQLGTR